MELFLTGSLAHGTELLTPEDVDAVEEFVTARLARREARTSWEQHLGPLLSHSQVLKLTGWSKQALSQAVREHRVLRLTGSGQQRFYPAAGFDDATPARPLPGAKRLLGLWAEADPQGWTTASWLTTPQVELEHRTPREVLLAAGTAPEELLALAGQAIDRLAA
ncbi:hypothetical protein DQ237_10900 [Blastococcus sp. TF02-8]|nr:hypothetical protein DQ237_10900 [Blastococcus sp. TF02-8]